MGAGCRWLTWPLACHEITQHMGFEHLLCATQGLTQDGSETGSDRDHIQERMSSGRPDDPTSGFTIDTITYPE